MKDYSKLAKKTSAILQRWLADGRGNCNRGYRRLYELQRKQAGKASKQKRDALRPSPPGLEGGTFGRQLA
jgi:hypothetical protein